jgi:Tfp pilus assembly protein PilF
LSLLKRAAEIDNSLRIVQLDLGAIYLQQKNFEMAKAALQRAVELAPQEPDAHYQLGRLYRALGDEVAAKNELQQAQKLHQRTDESLVGKLAASPPALNSSQKNEQEKQ